MSGPRAWPPESPVNETTVTTPYHIGWRPRSRRTPSSRFRDRRPRRPWQSEDGVDRFARRAFSPRAAERKMRRDLEHRTATGKPSGWQRRRAWRAEHLPGWMQ